MPRALAFTPWLWGLCALLCAAYGCEEFDPVETQNLCDGAAPISMRCPQCLKPKYDAKCALCHVENPDLEVCEIDEDTEHDPATGAGKGGEDAASGGAGESGASGAGEGGAGASGEGGAGQGGESGSGGMPASGAGGGPAMMPDVCN